MYKKNFKYLYYIDKIKQYFSRRAKLVLDFNDFLDYMYTASELNENGVLRGNHQYTHPNFTTLHSLPEFRKVSVSELASFFLKADEDNLIKQKLYQKDTLLKLIETMNYYELSDQEKTEIENLAGMSFMLNAKAIAIVTKNREYEKRKSKEFQYSRLAITISVGLLILEIFQFFKQQ